MTTRTVLGQLALFDADPALLIESDGRTIDTEHGPVDLVAVERAMADERLHLTRAEHRYIEGLIDAYLNADPRDRRSA
jgi:hypothetical protein